MIAGKTYNELMTYSASLQRLRRALAREGLRLRCTGGNQWGNYLIDDLNLIAYHDKH